MWKIGLRLNVDIVYSGEDGVIVVNFLVILVQLII